MKALGVVLIVIGIAIAAGAVYMAQTAGHLPSFFPGHAAGGTGKHTKRGIAGVILGVILLILGGVSLSRGRRSALRPSQ